jgi:hypothetical protein
MFLGGLNNYKDDDDVSNPLSEYYIADDHVGSNLEIFLSLS